MSVEPPATGDRSLAAGAPAHRRRWLLPVAIGGGILLTLIVALAIGYAVLSGQRTPAVVVSSFLDELVSGDAAGARSWLARLPEGEPVLLQPDTYATIESPVTSFTIVDTVVTDTSAVATVEVLQGAETYTADLTLSLIRKDLGVLDVWRVDEAVLPRVELSYPRPEGMGLTVNGTAFETGTTDEWTLPALPGTYRFEPTGSTEFYTAQTVVVTVGFADVPEPVVLTPELTESGVAAAQLAVAEHLDACLAQTTLAPTGNCGFAVTQDDATYSNIRWSLLSRPTVTFGEYDPGRGWRVVPEAPGSMRLDADYSLPGETGTAEAIIEGFEQAGFVTVDASGTATFESVIYE